LRIEGRGTFQMAELASPLPGLVATVHVKVGDQVTAGDPVVTMQSMKMEIPVAAEADGTVEEILVNEGDEIDTGALLVRIG
jgi:biotin carboxyl carrier protein